MQPRSERTAAEGTSPGTLGEGGEAEAGREPPSRPESELTVHLTRGMAMGASGGHGNPQLHCRPLSMVVGVPAPGCWATASRAPTSPPGGQS